MTPKLCPVCVGRGTVPKDLYSASLPVDWEPGDLPHIREDCPEVDCQTCEGLGAVWPPSTVAYEEPFDEEGNFTFTAPGAGRVYVTTSSLGVTYTDLYDWDEATSTTPKPALSLVEGTKAEDDD